MLHLAASACVSTSSELSLPATGAVAMSDAFAPAGAVSCSAPSATSPRFVDTTESWMGPLGLTVQGNRLAVADLDGDGYPDLVVHAVTSNKREEKGVDKRLVWQLMNRPTPNGQGRMFVDATGSGLFQARGGIDTHYRSAQLAVFADVDNDGDLDAFGGTYVDPTKPATDPGDRSEVLLNDGKGHFTFAQASAPRPSAAELKPTTSAAFTDVDRDGRIDLFVGYFYEYYGRTYQGLQAQLFKGTGVGGAFTDATSAAGLATTRDGFAAGTNHRPAYGVTACDLDDDGAPELLVSAYGRQQNLLYVNDGRGAFVEQGRASGFAGDEDVDFRDNAFFQCWCVQYPGSPKCAGVAPPQVSCPTPAGANWNDGVDDAPWRNNGNTFTTFCGDVDGDGKNDLYNAEIHHWWAGGASDSSELLKNVSTQGQARFTRPGNAATGLTWPHPTTDWNEGGLMAAGGDLDNDGRLDLVVAASDYADQYGLVFQQQADGTFAEQGAAWGVHHPCASGLAVADFDRDGDLDVLVGSGTARDCSATWKANEVHLYENQGTARSWLLLRLRGDGTTTNRAAIGAKVTVKAGGRTVTREVSGGYGHFGMQSDLVLHVGLGGCDGAEEVSVRWPDAAGTVQTYRNVPGSRFIELRQGDGALYRVEGLELPGL
ncbi:MAG: hypothetical protein AMXMBFR34_38260 [Myxococcaceae bacterium]